MALETLSSPMANNLSNGFGNLELPYYPSGLGVCEGRPFLQNETRYVKLDNFCIITSHQSLHGK